MGGLDPAWVSVVPAMFRSAAQSIEARRARLVGDPAALRAAAATWRGQAGTLDALWQRVEGHRGQLRSVWHGDAATTSDARAGAVEGELSATATSLAFAADGLDLAASVVESVQRRGDAVVVAYVGALRKLVDWYRAAPASAKVTALQVVVELGTRFGAEALQRVYGEECTLDEFMASMPRRFELGAEAPWRSTLRTNVETLKPMVDESVDGTTRLALTLGAVRTTRGEGTFTYARQDGKVVVGLTDSYAGSAYGSFGAKLSWDRIPPAARELLTRWYGELEAGPVLTYQQRYTFGSDTEAQAFVHRLGDGPWAWARNVGGFVTGPIADFGPWHRDLVGRDADETTWTLGLGAKAGGDAGTWPLIAGHAQVSTDEGGTLTVRKSGSWSFSLQSTSAAKGAGTLLGGTGVLGAAWGGSRRIDYDEHNVPLRYTAQETSTGDYGYGGGTAYGYVGRRNPVGTVLPKGAHVKLDDEDSTRTMRSYVLDLTDTTNQDEYENAATRNLARVIPDPAKDPAWAAFLRRRATLVEQEVGIDRATSDTSATVGVGGVSAGAKYSTSRERQRQLDAWYYNPVSPYSRDANGRPQMRPMPRDRSGPVWPDAAPPAP